MAERQGSVAPSRSEQSSTAPARNEQNLMAQRLDRSRSYGLLGSPFGSLRRFAEEMDRMFDELTFGRRASGAPLRQVSSTEVWAPNVDIFQRGNELVVKADLPGLSKDEVTVDVSDDAITISGERRKEREEEREGVYVVERSYGSFYRTIPLPEGAITEQAKAQFKDGVLEITMPAPSAQATRGRRLQIEGEKSQR